MCSTSLSLPGAVKEKDMIKVTDCNVLENLPEFYIFIWSTAPDGDEDIWAIKLYSGRMQIQSCFTFCQKLFWSNDHFSKKKTFGQMTIFRKKPFGQMTLRSNDSSVK
jgi:hypothetical protein